MQQVSNRLSRTLFKSVRRNLSARPHPAAAPDFFQIGSREIFDESHDMYRETVRKFFQDEVVPHHDKWEEAGEVPRDLWLAAGETGMLGVPTPEEYGGMGVDILYSAIVWEEQVYTGCTGPGFALHSDIVCPYLVNYGSEEQKQKYLPKLCSGEYIGALAMTEPSAGSDFANIKTVAKKDGDDYIINGSKVFITNGWHSDVVILCAKTDTTKGAHGISLFVIENGMEGFKKGKKLKKMGLKAQDTSELFFEDLRVPKSAMLGEEGKGFYYVMQELPQERMLIADIGCAAAEACYEWTREYVKERKAFKGTLSDLQTVKHKLAELKTEIAVGRTFTDSCLSLLKEHKLTTEMASMAKYKLTDLQLEAAHVGVQLHGGWGYMQEYPVCRAFVDARVQSIYGGSNEIMKELISRSI